MLEIADEQEAVIDILKSVVDGSFGRKTEEYLGLDDVQSLPECVRFEIGNRLERAGAGTVGSLAGKVMLTPVVKSAIMSALEDKFGNLSKRARGGVGLAVSLYSIQGFSNCAGSIE